MYFVSRGFDSTKDPGTGSLAVNHEQAALGTTRFKTSVALFLYAIWRVPLAMSQIWLTRR